MNVPVECVSQAFFPPPPLKDFLTNLSDNQPAIRFEYSDSVVIE